MFESEATARHECAVWRERADFIIGVRLPEPDKWEQLWSRRLAETRFEVCCIPFLAYDLALGDVVETKPEGGRDFMVARVVKPSGHRTMRVWFHNTAIAREVEDELLAAGALLEWRGSWSRLLALDAEDDKTTRTLAEALRPYEADGTLSVETAWS